ncbi:hypothetical protein HYPSUDRAFT_219850 [Hypholoma sublateritium FD-334 SS-4]|uniref:Uncharacterized protein n=1 Tax=Hypholoma sublateritium (strain FD-334 SS-4) TaxID=945553 RepID=A0A0D2P5R2_HYPSF|nr:hypothetical protein HYPSUDRAFT_219850 [Hypholoma sublateritium FD-334 SS-4]
MTHARRVPDAFRSLPLVLPSTALAHRQYSRTCVRLFISRLVHVDRGDAHPSNTSHHSPGRGAVTEGTRAASCLSFPACQQRVAEPRSSASPNKGPRGRTISAKLAADHPKARGNTAPFRRRSFLIPLYVAPQSTVHKPRGYRAAFCTIPPAKTQIDANIVHSCDNRASAKRPPGRLEARPMHIIPFGNLPPVSARCSQAPRRTSRARTTARAWAFRAITDAHGDAADAAHVARPRATIRPWSTASARRAENTAANGSEAATQEWRRHVPPARRAQSGPAQKGLMTSRLYISGAHAIRPASVSFVRPPRRKQTPSRTGPKPAARPPPLLRTLFK